MFLDLGSGVNPAPAPWVTIDCDETHKPDIVADVRQLPFEADSADRLMASHVLEHIPLDQLHITLLEWRRVLAPGGVLMIVGPDIERAVRQNEPHWLLEDIIAHGDPPGGHAWTMSEPVLLHFLGAAGWMTQSRDVRSVHLPEWPSAQPEAAWQLAVQCWLP